MFKKITPLIFIGIIIVLIGSLVYIDNNFDYDEVQTKNKIDVRFNAPDLLYGMTFYSGFCSNDRGEQGACYAKTFLYTSGKLIEESNSVSSITEKQLSQDFIERITKQIKDSELLLKKCDSGLTTDVSWTYSINLSGQKRIFDSRTIGDCQIKLNEINNLIEIEAENQLIIQHLN